MFSSFTIRRTRKPNPAGRREGVLGRLQRRFRNARPGSVLILVVALLVLMALIGTAWLSTVQLDRYATKQNAFSTQIDLLVDGVINMDKAAHIDDLVAGGVARPASGDFGNFDTSQSDGFVASRVPVAFIDVCPPWTDAEPSHPVDPAFVPVVPFVQDPPHPRKYYEGQCVRFPAGAVVPATQYFVCMQTHTVALTGAAENLADSIVFGDPTTHLGTYWMFIGEEGTPPLAVPVTPTPNGPAIIPPAPGPGLFVYSKTPVWPMITRLFGTDKFDDLRGAHADSGVRTFAIPTYMEFANDTKFPALTIYSSKANPAAAAPLAQRGMATIPAADTDGDGVADAALFRIPVGTLDGIDYYAALRVVDNGAAINFNTAFDSSTDFPMAGGAVVDYLGMFRANIGLNAVLNPDPAARPKEMTAINSLRWGTAGLPAATSMHPGSPIAFRTVAEAVETDMSRRLGNAVGAYNPFSIGDGTALAYHGGLLRNPDASMTRFEQNMANASPTPLPQPPGSTVPGDYDPVSDRVANRGTQVFTKYTEAPRDFPRAQHYYDPPSYGTGVWPSFIYRWFDENFNHWGYTDNPSAVVFPAPGTVYPPATAGGARYFMGADQYDLAGAPANTIRRNLRPLLVARNPVSNQAPLKLAAGATPAPAMLPFAAVQPRASVNTATFGELWRAYFCVMANEWAAVGGAPSPVQTPFTDHYRFFRDDLTTPPTAVYTSGWHADPFVGMYFNSDGPGPAAQRRITPTLPTNAGNPAAPFTHAGSGVTVPLQHPARMFRSVLRPPYDDLAATPWHATTPRMQPDQVLLLRSALAALNTIQLRPGNSGDVITPVDIAIPGTTEPATGFAGDASPALTVRVFPVARQPFITEVYADNNSASRTATPMSTAINPNGYVAIELYNPHPIPIDILNCKLATIVRQSSTRVAAAGPPGSHAFVHSNAAATPNKLTVVDRSPTAPTPLAADQQIDLRTALSNMEPSATGDYHDPCIIPAFGWLVLENYDARSGPSGLPPSPDARAASYRPPALGVPGTTGVDRGYLDDGGPIKTQNNTANPSLAARVPLMNFAYVPNLDRVLDQEVVLVRPLDIQGGATGNVGNPDGSTSVVPVLRYGALPTGALAPAVDMAPIDSFDFTGLVHQSALTVTRAYAWHYARACSTASGKVWRCVYPGRYDGNKSVVAAGGIQRPRQQGVDEVADAVGVGWDAALASPWEEGNPSLAPPGIAPEPGFSLGHSRDLFGTNPLANPANASYPNEFPTQIRNIGWPGPTGGYPHGGFARDGDIMQVTYTGAYRIKLADQVVVDPVDPLYAEVLELNTLPMDTSFAEDTDPINDPPDNLVGPADVPGVRREQIGRFCPLVPWDLSVAARGKVDAATATTIVDAERTEVLDYWGGPAGGTGPNEIFYDLVLTSGANRGRHRIVAGFDDTSHTLFTTASAPWGGTAVPQAGDTYELRRGNYRWATKLFDYLTVHSPHEDAVPNIPAVTSPGTAVSNYGGTAGVPGAATNAELTAPVEGLININTAPWRVVAALPWPSFGGGGNDNFAYDQNTGTMTAVYPGPANGVPDNYDFARALVAFRDVEIAAGADPQHVFQSIFDLYRVPALMYAADQLDLAPGTDHDDAAGDLSPFGPGTDGVIGDFEDQFLTLTRLSNLITTRSDSFTNYLLVQGWRGIGTANPELVVQRRRAFMTDRSAVTTSAKNVTTQFFYNE